MLEHASGSGRPRQAHATPPVLPLVGILARAPLPDDLEARLVAHFGPVVERDGPWLFDDTRYYEAEMGAGLSRVFLAFAPASAGRLAAWKIASGRIEERYRLPGGRRVNLDPGCVTLGGLFLASTKDGPQRLYLSDGIHAEITLHYRRGGWEALPWTFPDFRSGRYDEFLTRCRRRLCGAPRAREGA
jgi:hypothetical protein